MITRSNDPFAGSIRFTSQPAGALARMVAPVTIAHRAGFQGVGISTVQAIEAADDAATVDAGGLETTRDYRAGARAESLGKIAKALGSAGVTFLPDDGKQGPGIRGKAKRR